MTVKLEPFAVREKHAANYLDVSIARFRELERIGLLPAPLDIGGDRRWVLKQLRECFTSERFTSEQLTDMLDDTLNPAAFDYAEFLNEKT